jgi:type I restriction enzyme S subunit
MARGKKKESTLTPEEKLERALVPESKWPYRVPQNWCWTTVGAVNQYDGGSVDPLKEPNKWFNII